MPSSADLELSWPPELFAAEARALLEPRRSGSAGWSDSAELLLEEAFTGTVPLERFRSLEAPDHSWGQATDDPWAPSPRETPEAFLRELADTSSSLPRSDRPRPHWSSRRGQRSGEVRLGTVSASPSVPMVTVDSRLAERFLRLVEDLIGRGYFEHALPARCEDDNDNDTDLADPSLALLDRIGVPDLWPLATSRPRWDPAVDRDTFYDLIEALHDLAARPRSRSYHSYWRHWHYAEFSSPAGQHLYRWRVNRLLKLHGVDLRLAGSGEDLGRLVRIVDDERDDLVQRVVAAGPERSTREHAVALFRGRGVGVPEKRSAIVALYGLMEERRDLIKAELLTKDEAALFQIANQFTVRHRGADQRGDYDEAYLDWLFWWYLATVDLLDHLEARQAGGSPASPV